jgi:hypothetical protein
MGAMSAGEWRAFWEVRGVRELRLLLWAGWDPIRGVPLAGYEGHALRLASLLGSRASRSSIAAELGRIRRDELGLDPSPAEDARAAEKIAIWFEAAAS